MTTQDNLLYSRVVDYDREGVKRVKAELRADFPGAIVRSHKRIVRAGGTSFPVTVILVIRQPTLIFACAYPLEGAEGVWCYELSYRDPFAFVAERLTATTADEAERELRALVEAEGCDWASGAIEDMIAWEAMPPETVVVS